MIYYTETKPWDHDKLMNSLSKGRDDYFEVLHRMGMTGIAIPVYRPQRFLSLRERLILEYKTTKAWKAAVKGLGNGDILVIHSPCSEKFTSYAEIIKKLRKKGCRVITIMFELETFFDMDHRNAAYLKRATSRRIENRLLEISDAVVVHNDLMKSMLASSGADADKMFSVGVMDYLRDEPLDSKKTERIDIGKPVIFAGNLSAEKSTFQYNLPDGFRCNLYGSDYTGAENDCIRYKGVFDPIELMDKMEGSFGLVWDGDSVDELNGTYGKYLTYNNPHKIAVYLASGIPVIVWNGTAMADFVRKEKCGITVSSLREVPGRIKEMPSGEYEAMRLNACRVGNEMRQGIHIRNAVEKALEYIDAK